MCRCDLWKRSVRAALGAILLACTASTPMASAATETKKTAAVHKGLAYLYNTQQAGGYWSSSGYEQATTGAAAFAFLSQRDKWDRNADQYQAAVDKAITYLVSTANTIEVSTRNDGVNICPGRAGSCKAVYWFGNARSTYTTGLVAPAIAAYGLTMGAEVVATTSGPLAGMTWGQIAQGITNAFAVSQSTSGNGNRAGGWGYLIPGNGDSDSFSTQWAVISFVYDETLGAITPEAVKDGLRIWLNNVQNASGAVCSQPGTEPCSQADTGGWLLSMKFAGYDVTDSQLQAALAFLNREWRSTAGASLGSFGQPYAMWAVYKGLATTIGLSDTTHIVSLLTDCGATTKELPGDPSGSGACTWSEDYNQWLVENQKVDGSWGGSSDSPGPLAAALYVNSLGATQIPMRANQLPANSTLQRTGATPQVQGPTVASVRKSSIAFSPMASAQVGQPAAANSDKPRKRVRSGVTALAVNGDGSALASASSDNRILILSPTTGVQRLALQGSLGLPTGLAFTGGGATLSSVARDSFVRLWDGASGRELAKLAGPEHAINAVTASPDGALLATAGEETRIMLWDQTSRKLSKILFGPKDFVNTLSFSPDSRLLAGAGEEARVFIFDVAAGKLLFTLLGHAGPIDTVVFSPNGTVLASAGQDTVIHLWDTVNGQQRQALSGHSAPIRTIAFSPDGRSIASAGEDTQIRLWNAATGALDKILAGSTGVINALVFIPGGLFLASGTEAGDITLWNVTTGAKLITIRVL
jgi:WD40 repeat protein